MNTKYIIKQLPQQSNLVFPFSAGFDVMVLKYQQLINQPSRDQQAIAELLQASV